MNTESRHIHAGFDSHAWERKISPYVIGGKSSQRQDSGDGAPQFIP
jgi:hypothetical protein